MENILEMFQRGLYAEFKMLYKDSQKGEISEELLEETLGYRQFLEMAKVSKKSPIELNTKDLMKVKKWIIKDILKYAYRQSLDYKKFPNIQLVRNFKQAKKIVDSFLNLKIWQNSILGAILFFEFFVIVFLYYRYNFRILKGG